MLLELIKVVIIPPQGANFMEAVNFQEFELTYPILLNPIEQNPVSVVEFDHFTEKLFVIPPTVSKRAGEGVESGELFSGFADSVREALKTAPITSQDQINYGRNTFVDTPENIQRHLKNLATYINTVPVFGDDRDKFTVGRLLTKIGLELPSDWRNCVVTGTIVDEAWSISYRLAYGIGQDLWRIRSGIPEKPPFAEHLDGYDEVFNPAKYKFYVLKYGNDKLADVIVDTASPSYDENTWLKGLSKFLGKYLTMRPDARTLMSELVFPCGFVLTNRDSTRVLLRKSQDKEPVRYLLLNMEYIQDINTEGVFEFEAPTVAHEFDHFETDIKFPNLGSNILTEIAGIFLQLEEMHRLDPSIGEWWANSTKEKVLADLSNQKLSQFPYYSLVNLLLRNIEWVSGSDYTTVVNHNVLEAYRPRLAVIRDRLK